MSLRSLVRPFQFAHAWILSRMLAGTCNEIHQVNGGHALIVAPHPDDETLGCGGLIATKRALGAEVTIVYLTDGSAGTNLPSEPPSFSLAQQRQGEALAALRHLGVLEGQVEFWNYPDGALTELSLEAEHTIVARLATKLRDLRIREVYVPHRCDGHPDHQRAFTWTKTAVAQLDLQIRLFQYAIWMWWSQPFLWRLPWKWLKNRTRHHVGEGLEKKRTALRCHVSQGPRFPLGFLRSHPMKTELFFEANVGPSGAGKVRLI